MLRPLRETAQAVLQEAPAARRPALRRSDDSEALLATDLPLLVDEAAVEAFKARMTALGWRVWQAGDWLLMDVAVPVPEASLPAELIGEPGCCVSLLLRHPEGLPDPVAIREVVKAAESGRAALERLCARWHAEWAAALREHRNLPGGLMPYLCRAIDMTRR